MKRWIPLLLVVALLVPVLLAVPVSAEITASGTSGGLSWYIDDLVLVLAGTGAGASYTSSYSAPWSGIISDVNIGSGVSGLGNYFFDNCNIGTVIFPDSVASLGTHIFSKSTGTAVYWNNTLTFVPKQCFYLSAIDDVFLTDNVTSIRDSAFHSSSCTVHVPSVPPSLGNTCFLKFTGSIVVPYGSLNDYLSDPDWAQYAQYFVEAIPSVPDFIVTQSWDSSTTYSYQEESIAGVFSVSSGVSGWTTTYQWYYGSSQGGTFTAMPAETLATFSPKTTADYLGTSVYYCAVTLSDSSTGASKTVNSGYLSVQVTEAEPPATEPGGGGGGGGDSGTSAPDYSEKLENIQEELGNLSQGLDDVQNAVEDVPGQVVDGMGELQQQEKEEASTEGDAGAQQVIEIVPNPSADFLPALQNFTSAMSYTGTVAVLTLPAVSIPAISGVIPEIYLMDPQEVNFEDYIVLIPEIALSLVRALFDIALVVYCLKELMDMLESVFGGIFKRR